ncbi:MAG: putative metal-binding motif-containing protein [bacterium]
MGRRNMTARWPLGLSTALALSLSIAAAPLPAAAQPVWTHHGQVAQGGQIDAQRGPNDRIHLVSSRYYQLDAGGGVVTDEAQGDDQQGALDFPPALAVGADGTVHLITRHGGSWETGHDIRYRRRNAGGTWDVDYLFGGQVRRNYAVGIAWAGAADVVFGSSQAGVDVWGDIHLFQEGGGSASALGDLGGIWRGDCDFRLRGRNGTVYLVSGKSDPDGTAYFSWGAAGGGLYTALGANLQEHRSGTGRRAFPDLYVDSTGQVHLTYAALHEVYYNRYSASGTKALAQDVRVFDGLGDWHMSTGLSAVAGADDGQTVLAVALRSDGSQGASDSDLLWAYSVDGGATWTAQADLGWNTDGGEGRRRPRIVAIGQTFYVFFKDNAHTGISLATVTIAPDGDGDGYGSDEDCDDTDPNVHPGAPELCNGIDDNCDDQTDEGCPAGPDAGVTPDSGMADASAQDAAVGDAGAAPDGDLTPGGVSGGCACAAPAGQRPGNAPAWPWLALAIGLYLRRRRARD